MASFTPWPEQELQEDTLLIVAYSLSKYKVANKPVEDVKFNIAWAGVLGVVDNS